MILEKIKNIFFNKNKNQNKIIKWFDDAYLLIKKYEKTKDYATCIFAIKELSLKNTIAINYYEKLIIKLSILENSNIEEISSKAKEKIKKINNFLNVLYKRLSILDKKFLKVENLLYKLEERNKLKTLEKKPFFRNFFRELKEKIKSNNFLEFFLAKIKNIFFNKNKNQNKIIKWFDDAYLLIKKYEKTKDYATCIFAIKELSLKNTIAINYYEKLIIKLSILENSNIEEISSKAKEKIKKINNFLNVLYKRLSILDKKFLKVENLLYKLEEKNRLELEELNINRKIQEIKLYFFKKDYTTALTQAKKLAFDYEKNKHVFKILTKAQNLYDKEKRIQEKELQSKFKINKILSDLWVTTEETQLKLQEKIFFKNIFNFFINIIRKSKEKTEHMTRIRTLIKLEKLLTISWNIENVSWLKINSDKMFWIVNDWLIKDLTDFKIYWFDVYGKIIWKDKIIWDNFWYYKKNNKVIFYFWDATWHWIKAWFTIAVLSKLFFEYTKENLSFQEFFVKINNWLKEKIKWKEFITWIFFEWDYVKNSLKIIWAWHLPIFLYRKDSWVLEKVIAWWLALWVRMINNSSSVKIKEIKLEHNDIMVWYTDWIIEAKDVNWNMFWMNFLEKSVLKYCTNLTNPEKIYWNILNDVNEFRWTVPFNDDVSVFVFNRNFDKDIIKNKNELENIAKEHNSKKTIKDILFKKTKEELIEEMRQERYNKELKIRLNRLDNLYKIWEYIKLKQEIILYYKEWYCHDKMRIYLEKALGKEHLVVLRKQDEKLQRKYESIVNLYKKWDYELVIKEALDVVFKNWKI